MKTQKQINKIGIALLISYLFCMHGVRNLQIARFGIDFISDYRKANRHAWLHCATIILAILLVLAATFSTLMDNIKDSDFLHFFFYFFSSGLHQNQILTAPMITYIYFMRNLQTRYAALNQLLRYSLPPSEVCSYIL